MWKSLYQVLVVRFPTFGARSVIESKVRELTFLLSNNVFIFIKNSYILHCDLLPFVDAPFASCVSAWQFCEFPDGKFADDAFKCSIEKIR